MNDYYKMNVEKTLDKLDTNLNGLTDAEVINRQKHGKNIIEKKKKTNIFNLFLLEFKDPIIIVLLISALFSFVIGESIDALVILFIILVDAIIGTFEEYKADKNVEALQSLIKITAKVMRNSREMEIDSSQLVAGDILYLEAGNKVPADARIIKSKNLTLDESILTGESINCHKEAKTFLKDTSVFERTNMVYLGTSVITGRALCVITDIGKNTELGKIANEVNNIKGEKSPLTIRIEKFSKQISFIILLISIILAITLKLKGYNESDIFLSVVALAVSAMPEGLPLALTMALTIASNKMLKKNVIVKKLNAVESLGSCTVIASDKTGTLTVNEQTAKKIVLPDESIFDVSGSGYNKTGSVIPVDDAKLNYLSRLIKNTNINNEATVEKNNTIGDSIDIAFKFLGLKYGVDIENIEKLDFIPYECENKYSLTYYKDNGKTYCTVKGSIEVVLDFCDFMVVKGRKKKIDKDRLLKQNENLAKDGYRVIAVASIVTDNEPDLKSIPRLAFDGMVAFIDPVRRNVITSINKCKKAGIKVVMITGDHPLTAYKIAKTLKIADYYNDVANSKDIEKEYLKSEEEFDNFIRNKTVFSRVTPIQKLQIIESFKRQGEYVAVTGDGVNDAPALKSANIGIAMGSGSDVAKESASMIIADNNFNSIVNGIEEGRVAYGNIRKICYFLLSSGLAEVLFFILSIILNIPIPLLAIQLLWLNVVTDGLQDIALSFEKEENDVMMQKPRNPQESLFDKNMIVQILISGLFIGISVFAFWYYLINCVNMPIKVARGYILTLMVFIQNIHLFNCRSEMNSAFDIPILKNPFIIISILLAIISQILIIKIPYFSNLFKITDIPLEHIILLFTFAIPVILIMEIYKAIKNYLKN